MYVLFNMKKKNQRSAQNYKDCIRSDSLALNLLGHAMCDWNCKCDFGPFTIFIDVFLHIRRIVPSS